MPPSWSAPVSEAALFDAAASDLPTLPSRPECGPVPRALASLALAPRCGEPAALAPPCVEPPRPEVFVPDALAPSLLAAVAARERGWRPPRRRLFLRVTFRAFGMYRALISLRSLPSFGHRSIWYVSPSTPNVQVWTSFPSPHISQVRDTWVIVAINPKSQPGPAGEPMPPPSIPRAWPRVCPTAVGTGSRCNRRELPRQTLRKHRHLHGAVRRAAGPGKQRTWLSGPGGKRKGLTL